MGFFSPQVQRYSRNIEPYYKEFELVSFLNSFDKSTVKKSSGSMSGGFFLCIGSIGGSYSSEQKEEIGYILRYAIKDEKGIKLECKKVKRDKDDIVDWFDHYRIVEIDKKEKPVMRVHYTGHEWVEADTVTSRHPFWEYTSFHIPKGKIMGGFDVKI